MNYYVSSEHMKTIFDWLTMPAFRERMAMYIGQRSLTALDIWMMGYQMACRDNNEYNRLRTSYGVPVELLRDYIAMMENDSSSGGIQYILEQAANGDVQNAVDRFFTHVDAFVKLRIVSVYRALIEPDMKPTFSSTPENMPYAFRKVSLTDGLCWIVAETPAYERYWDCINTLDWPIGSLAIGPEEKANALMAFTYRSLLDWRASDGSPYPKPYNESLMDQSRC